MDTSTRTGRRRPASGAEPRIGVISDTHGLIRPEALAALQGVDAILHAGDIGGHHVIEALSEIAPVTFVRGNNDDSNGYDVVRVTIGDQRILLTHIYRPELLQQEADIIVFGHSHQPRNEVIDGVLLFNPASAGPRRFKLPVMVGIIEGKRAYHIDLAR
ncbi:MAG TPA: metallophosphoesterase family protein [Thermoanaerobaculia bacterium]